VTTPYYQDELVTLFLGDCLEIDAWTFADILVTDPPYGMTYESNFNRDSRNTKAGTAITGDATTAARDAALRWWGTGRPGLVFGRWNVPRPTNLTARLIWDRGYHGMGDLSFPWGPADEEISQRPDHPTPKPIPLLERLIEKCPPGTIADPFAGSGSTLVAARNLGRKAIGVEIEERYCEIIAKRLDQMCLDFGETL